MKESTRIREAFYTDFSKKVKAMESSVPVQLSGGFRSRTGMADALYSGACDMIGLGRAAVLEPELPRKVLLNPEYDDERSVAESHIVRGQWFANIIPAKVIGAGLPIQFFYYSKSTVAKRSESCMLTNAFADMRRLGAGLKSDPNISIPGMLAVGLYETVRDGLHGLMQKVIAGWSGNGPVKVE